MKTSDKMCWYYISRFSILGFQSLTAFRYLPTTGPPSPRLLLQLITFVSLKVDPMREFQGARGRARGKASFGFFVACGEEYIQSLVEGRGARENQRNSGDPQNSLK